MPALPSADQLAQGVTCNLQGQLLSLLGPYAGDLSCAQAAWANLEACCRDYDWPIKQLTRQLGTSWQVQWMT